MARTADKNSNRQRGFKILNRLRQTKRSVAIDRLIDELGIGRSYAESLHAAHRTIGKEKGVYITTYRVLDNKDGNTVKPYLSTRKVYKPKASEFTTARLAVEDYINSQNRKIGDATDLIDNR